MCRAYVFVALSALLVVASANNIGEECVSEFSLAVGQLNSCKVYPVTNGPCDAGVYVSGIVPKMGGYRDMKGARCRLEGHPASLTFGEDGSPKTTPLFNYCAKRKNAGISCDDTKALVEAGVNVPRELDYAIQATVGGWDDHVGQDNIDNVVGALDEGVPKSGKNLVYVTIGALNSGSFHNPSMGCSSASIKAQTKPAFLAEAVQSGLFDKVIVEHFDSSSSGPTEANGVTTRATSAMFPLRITNRADSEAMAALVPILRRATSNGGACVILEAVTQHDYPFPKALAVHAGCTMMRAYCQESAEISVQAPGQSVHKVTSVSLADIGVQVPEEAFDLGDDVAPVESGIGLSEVVKNDIEEAVEEAKPMVDKAIQAAEENGETRVAKDLIIAEEEVAKAEKDAE